MLFKKESSLDKRLKHIEKELSSINGNMRTLSESARGVSAKVARNPGAGRVARDTDGKEDRHATKKRVAVASSGVRGERFAEYLASGFEAARPLRRERRIQRNKAVMMIISVLLMLFWVVCRFFLL